MYTDGACKGNPGSGGYAAVIKLNEVDTLEVISGGDQYTTNNRMELTAVIKGLAYVYDNNKLNKEDILLYTDSQYIVRAINENWLDNWINKQFKNVKNQDLWFMLWKYICKLNVKFQWVKGHDGNTYNELADQLASEACYFQDKAFTYKMNKN